VHAISVVFDLMQPFRALRRRVHHFAKLRLDPLWETGEGPRDLLILDFAITAAPEVL
jgi:hypothetical protein